MVKEALRGGPWTLLASQEDDWYDDMFIPKGTVMMVSTSTATLKFTARTPLTSIRQGFWTPTETSPRAHLKQQSLRKAMSRTVLGGVSM